jgi:hypothetical protein
LFQNILGIAILFFVRLATSLFPSFLSLLNCFAIHVDIDIFCLLYGSIWLGNGTATEEGNVHIKRVINVDDLHAAALEKNETDPDPILEEDSKIWLVPTDDLDETEQKMVDWNPGEILFEFDLLRTDPAES